jgi:hypothetical protein
VVADLHPITAPLFMSMHNAKKKNIYTYTVQQKKEIYFHTEE